MLVKNSELYKPVRYIVQKNFRFSVALSWFFCLATTWQRQTIKRTSCSVNAFHVCSVVFPVCHLPGAGFIFRVCDGTTLSHFEKKNHTDKTQKYEMKWKFGRFSEPDFGAFNHTESIVVGFKCVCVWICVLHASPALLKHLASWRQWNKSKL